MIKVYIAKHSGFCFGVKRAMNIIDDVAKTSKKKPIYTLGPIIHNPQTVDKLKERGVTPLDDIKNIEEGTVVLRTHGVEKNLLEKLKSSNLDVIDATCPFVSRAQNYVKKLRKNGYNVIIVGENNHPEVLALKSQVKDAIVIENAEEIEKIKILKGQKVGIVSQTTQSIENFKAMVCLVMDYFKEVLVINTICSATSQRQEAAIALAEKVDLMLIVGGKNSGNTKRLYTLCRRIATHTYHIETEKEIKKSMLKGVKSIGIAAGASTPDWIVNDVKTNIKKIYKEELKNDRKR
ncbi:MAG: 4-hydroxy-3-methylbut-2-enyl diphosphate reductase [bacterium]